MKQVTFITRTAYTPKNSPIDWPIDWGVVQNRQCRTSYNSYNYEEHHNNIFFLKKQCRFLDITAPISRENNEVNNKLLYRSPDIYIIWNM